MEKGEKTERLLRFIEHNARRVLKESGPEKREAVLQQMGKDMAGKVVDAGLSDIEAEEFTRKVLELMREHMLSSEAAAGTVEQQE
jgi:phosphotransacetylase